MTLDVVLPDSPAARTVREVTEQFSSRALVNHCIRSYLWAADHAVRHAVPFDAELLYVAAMLHDVGLAPAFDSATVPFEEAGGAVGWVFAAGAGWPADRRRRVGEVVVAHMRSGVDLADDPEGHLLALGTGMDISGRDPDRWSTEFRREVLDRYPRLGLADEFLRCLEDQARRKPDSAAAGFLASGGGDRLRANVLDRP